MSIKLNSTFAILDVKGVGRRKLAERMPPGSQRLPDAEHIPVVISGFITHQHGNDDGESIEFGIEVTEAEIRPPRPDITRVEVVDSAMRLFSAEGVHVEPQLQDEGRTLKLFLHQKQPLKRKKGWSLPPGGFKTARDPQRHGAVKKASSQIKNPITGTWTKRDDKSGLFVETRVNPEPFRGVRKKK